MAARDKPIVVIGILAILAVLMAPAVALANPSSESTHRLGARWLSRLEPGWQIPSDLAIRFGTAALSVGLSPGQAAAMLNDERFALAVGSPDSGYGMLESMIKHPERITEARILLQNHDLSASGSGSVQSALIEVAPALRNAYLADFGLMAVKAFTGVLVLVDIETGKQYIGQGKLGTQLRAPGGGPLPEPAFFAPSPSVGATPPVEPETVDGIAAAAGPGLNFSSDQSPALGLAPATGESNNHTVLTPGIYLVGVLFLLAWGGYAVLAIVRRLRS